MATKECIKCGKVKEVSEFRKDSSRKDGLRSYCKKCHNQLNIEWQKKNPEKVREYQRNWGRRNKKKRKASWERWWGNLTPRQRTKIKLSSRIRHSYGISYEQYMALRREQRDRCAICDVMPHGRRLDLDHHWTTGKARGLLCNRCNSALERLEKFKDWEAKARDYLAKHQ